MEVAIKEKLLGRTLHLDTTTLRLFGQYDLSVGDDVAKPAFGHSKAKRPDLKQMVMSLTVNGPAAMPLWFESLSGHSNDKTNFHDTISTFRQFAQSIDMPDDYIWVADAALYNSGNLDAATHKWLTRVPSNVKYVKSLLNQEIKEKDWQRLNDNYKAMKYAPAHKSKQTWTLYLTFRTLIKGTPSFEYQRIFY